VYENIKNKIFFYFKLSDEKNKYKNDYDFYGFPHQQQPSEKTNVLRSGI